MSTNEVTYDETVEVDEGTGAALIRFLEHLGSRNEIVPSTASALRTGCIKVLDADGDPAAVDLRTADIDSIVKRFRNKNRIGMKERTLNTYEQRFRQSVDMYLKFLADDPDWRPQTRTRAPSKARNGNERSRTRPVTTIDGGQRDGESAHLAAAPLITYPFPIRSGVTAQISLPADLSAREANRLAAFLAALAIDDDPQGSPSGDNGT